MGIVVRDPGPIPVDVDPGSVTGSASVNRGGVAGPTGPAGPTLAVNRPIVLRDNPAIDFTGATNTQPALQAALTAAGPRRIEWGQEGILRCDSGITLMEWQNLIGPNQFFGSGFTAPAEIRFAALTGSQVGVTGGGNTVIENLTLRGPHAATAAGDTYGYSSANGHPRFRNVSFMGWGTGTSLTGSYYSVFENCQWVRNKRAMLNSACYNMQLISPMMYCSYGTSEGLRGQGIAGAARGLTITGGSIEEYGPTGAVKVNTGETLTLTGVYFESALVGSNAVGIDAGGTTGVALNMHGCTAYLNRHTRFVNMAGALKLTIDSAGNKLISEAGTGAPTAYYWEAADITQIAGRIGYDDMSESLVTDYIKVEHYVRGQIQSLDIRHPALYYVGGVPSVAGTPNGALYGSVGNICTRRDGAAGSTLYVKETGAGTNTGWVAK